MDKNRGDLKKKLKNIYISFKKVKILPVFSTLSVLIFKKHLKIKDIKKKYNKTT